MADPNMSESEEMYLITLAKLAERGLEGPVPLATLAAELDVLPVSANQMVHKLQQEGVVEYLPYKGVALQPEGRRRANRTLRRRRLWELFLVDRLGIGFNEADALACRFEHVGSDALTERLAIFLGHPHTSSQGLPIPAVEETAAADEQPLSQMQVGRQYQVTAIQDASLQRFLESQKIQPGTALHLLAGSCEGQVLLEADGHRLELAPEAACNLLVKETKA